MERRDDDSVLRIAPDLEVRSKVKRGPKTSKEQVEEETEKIGLKTEDRAMWRDGVQRIAERMR